MYMQRAWGQISLIIIIIPDGPICTDTCSVRHIQMLRLILYVRYCHSHTPWDGHVGLEDGRTKVLQVSFVPIEQCLLQAHKVIRPDTGDVAGLPDG